MASVGSAPFSANLAPQHDFSPPLQTAMRDAGVWLVIPCYKVRNHILQVISRAPAAASCATSSSTDSNGREISSPRV